MLTLHFQARVRLHYRPRLPSLKEVTNGLHNLKKVFVRILKGAIT